MGWTRSFVVVIAIVAIATPAAAIAAPTAAPSTPAPSAYATPVASPLPTASAPTALTAPLAPPVAPSTVSLRGTLRVAVADDFAGGRSRTLYSIDGPAGSTQIAVSGSGIEKLDGALVHFSGSMQTDGSVAVSAGAIVVDKAAGANPAAAALGIRPRPATAVSPAAPKTETIAVVIADYSDMAGYPVTVAQAQSSFTSSQSSVHNLFDTTSGGRLETTTTVLGPWHLGIGQCAGGATSWSFSSSLNAATAVAKAHGVNLASYDHVVLWTKAPCYQGWAGVAYVPGQGVQIAVDWTDPAFSGDSSSSMESLSSMVASHELDHNLGLNHSNGLACFDGSGNQVTLIGKCVDAEYWDQYTTMGAAGAPDNALLDADQLDYLGWLDPSDSQTVVSEGTYSLVPVYSASPGVRLLRIARPETVLPGEVVGAWTLELRSTLAGSAFDQFSAAPFTPVTTGVTVRYSEDPFGPNNVLGFSYLIDTMADGSTTAGVDFWDAPLQPGQTFSDPVGGITVTVNSVDGSGASVTIGDTMAPTAPSYLEAAALPAGGAELDWGAASDNLSVAHYRIYRDGSQIGEVPGTGLTYVDPPAGFGGLHTYTVTAVDASGLEGTAATASATLRPPPSAPLAVTARAGNEAAQVSWSVPTVGAPMTGYTVTSEPDHHTCATSGATGCVVARLSNGTPYTFSVTATNPVGTGPASIASDPVTPLPVPGRPTDVSGVADDAAVAVTWTAPDDPGSDPIDGYTVTSSPDGRTCGGATIGCTVTGLTNGVVYTFTVVATSPRGEGLPSEPSSPVTPRTRPDPPANVVALASNGLALVSWSPPPFNGGSTVTAYDVVSSPDGLTCHTTGLRSCTISGLTNRISYTFKSTATNVAGTSDQSAPSPGSTPLLGATYVTVTPNRLVDSRSPTYLGLKASLGNNVAVCFQVTGRSTDQTLNIPTGAVAVTGNLTATNAGSGGYLSLTPNQPSGTPTTSTLNFPKGDTRANAVTVPLGAGGKLWVAFVGASGTRADVIFDVTGYFIGNTSGATYLPLTPNRVLDSRSPTRRGMSVSLTSGTPSSFQVTGKSTDPRLNVPSGAVAVVGNLTAVNTASAGYLSLTPTRPPGAPTTSTLNFPKGDTRANAVTVPLGAGGVLWVTFIGTGGTHADAIFDVTGFFMPDVSGATYVPVTPNRLVDSRSPTHLGLSKSLTLKLPAEFAAANRSGDEEMNVPVDAVGITGNLTAVGATAGGYLALTPVAPVGVPQTSTINFPKGDTRANAVTIPVGPDCGLWVTFVASTAAHADVVFDVSGYFTMK